MRLSFLLIPAITLCLIPGRGMAEPPVADAAARPSVYVIPIKGPINKSTLYIIRRGANEAEAAGAKAIIFTMDTPGGEVQTTEEIIKNISERKVPIYTFVEYNAISAGAIIAVATDKIYMTPGSKIGDAMPIMIAQGGNMQPLPDAEREKITAYVDTLVRTLAEKTGRDPKLLSCMVRRELEFKIGDEVICPEGQILTLTSLEATRIYGDAEKPLLADGLVENMTAMLKEVGLEGASIVEMEITWAEKVFQKIALISPFLLGAGFLGIMLAVYNPSLSTPALMFAGCCFFVFFFGHHVAGLAGWEEGIVFVIGLILIMLEIFVIPGFGITGITGLFLMLGALMAAMVQVYPGEIPQEQLIPFIPHMSDLVAPASILSSSIIGAGVIMMIFGHFVPRTRAFNSWLVLNKATSREDGFTSSGDTSSWEGKTGIAQTDLRPSGTGVFEEAYLDVVTQGEFIGKGTAIKVTEAHGNHIVVEKAE